MILHSEEQCENIKCKNRYFYSDRCLDINIGDEKDHKSYQKSTLLKKMMLFTNL